MTQHSELLQEIENLLDFEHRIMIEGDLGKLSVVVERKEKLLQELMQQNNLGQDYLSILRKKAQQNQMLVGSVRAGIDAAMKRLQALQKAQDPLTVYDPSGKTSDLQKIAKKSLERRA